MSEFVIGPEYFLPKQNEYVWTPDDGRPKDIALYLGGVGSGKTFSSVRKGYLISQIYPGSRGLVGGEDYPLIRDTTLGGVHGWLDFMETELGLVEGRHFRFNRNEHKIGFPNGSEVLFRGLRHQRKIKSLTLTWAHIEEASDITLESFLQVDARLRQGAPAGWMGDWRRFLFLSTNPEEVAGWIHDLFIAQEDNPEWTEGRKKAIDKIRPFIRYVHAPTTENDRLPDGYLDSMLALGDDDWVDVYVHGKTGGKGKGRVYRAFDRGIHVDGVGDRAFYRPDLPLRLALDFNVNPMTGSIHQVLPDKTILTFDEISIKDSGTQDLCEEFLRRYGPWGRAPHKGQVIVYGDAAGNSRSTKTSDSDYDIVRRMLSGKFSGGVAFRVPEANGPVKDRVNAVNAKLKSASGVVGWVIHQRCKTLIKDLELVRWREGTTDIDKKTDPRLTHMSDNAGYLVVWEFPVKPPSAGAVTVNQLRAIQQGRR
jgi:hypothetical protein